MNTDVLIVGGGLSGLALASKLEKSGVNYLVVEANDRLGGRILTKSVKETGFDYGPAWFWPGQPRMARAIEELGLGYFGQYSNGSIKYEESDGKVFANRGFSSMQGSYRVKGGTGALINALAQRLSKENILLSHVLHSVEQTVQGISAEFNAPKGQVQIHAKKIVLALPPRVAEEKIAFKSEIPQTALQAMRQIPTWMAGQAKILGIYDRPYWRDAGFSGDAMSRRGPMVEIHDASPSEGGPYALFGFVGFSANDRLQLGDEILKMAKEQLVNIFGPEMGNPLSLEIKDWAQDIRVATPLDANGPGYHPAYGLPAAMRNLWDGKLIFGSTETAHQFGGFLEGALEAADQVFATLNVKDLQKVSV
jgi:monoamine oxidase